MTQFKIVPTLIIAALFVVGGIVVERTTADDVPPKKDAAPKDAASPANDSKKPADSVEDAKKNTDSAEEWAKLNVRKLEISKTLQELRQKFATANRDARVKIRDEFQGLIDEFQQKLLPRLTEIAPAVYEQDPKNFEAGESVVENAYSSNQYDKATKIADHLITDGDTSNRIVNLAGAAHFAAHDFEKAEKILDDAAKNGQLDPNRGQRWLKPANDYIELWSKEQAIRKREANADKDHLLPRVSLKTNRGEVVIELFENEAPNTVANFVSLVENKKYDGTRFHRVIPNFMVQGGDPNSLDEDPTNDGIGGPGYTIECECFRDDMRYHFRGSLSMAHAGKDTGGSQFFITHLPTYWLNADKQRQSGHTVFGRVIQGLEIVEAIQKGDEIVSATVIRKRDHEYKPKTTAKETP